MRAQALAGPEHSHRTARGVEHRHRIDQHVARPKPGALSIEPRIVGEPAMMELRALREAGCARGVLDLRYVTGLNLGQCRFRWRRAQEVLPLGEQHNLTKRRDLWPDLIQV